MESMSGVLAEISLIYMSDGDEGEEAVESKRSGTKHDDRFKALVEDQIFKKLENC